MSIIDLQGRVLVGVGWQDICTRFHRVHPETCRHCIESDTQLSADLAPGQCRLYRCKNNMWDIATPLLVGDHHVGNLFSGQFFFEDEPVDRELFRSQAQRYGFDEREYLAALDAVPRLGRDAVDTGMTFLTKLARMLSQLSFSNAQLAHSLEERGMLMESLQENRERLNRAQEIAHLGSWELDLSTGVLTWSDEVYRLFGLKPQEFEATYEAFLNAVHPDDRATVDAAYSASVREGRSSYEIEHRIVRSETGEIRWVREKCQHVKDEAGKVILSRGMVLDITSRKRQEQHLQRLNRTLKVLSYSGQALIHATDEAAYLEEVCRIIAGGGYAMTWIGFVEEDENKTVRPVASAGLEEGYLATLDVTWADTERGRGPTGTAVRTGRTQMCRNMLTDPAFAPWREEAIKRGYASSICLPLLDAGKVFGVLTIYETEPDSFAEDDVRLLTELAGDLAFGITSLRLRTANAQAARDLLHSEERFRLLSETAGRLLTTENPQGIVNSLCHDVMKHLDCQVFFNFLVDERAGRLRLNACEGIPEEEVRRIEQLDYGVAVCGCVARDGVRIVSEDIAVTEDPRTDLVRSYGVQAYACHPLIAEGKVLGTLSFGTTTRTRFSEDDLSLMKTVADQVAVAMQRISSQKERQRHLDFHIRLLQMTRDILNVADLQTVLQMVADVSVELTGAKLGAAGHGFINGRLQVQAVSYGSDAPLCQMEGGFSVVKGGVHMDLIGSRESIRLTDEELRTHSDWSGLPQGHVPLRGLLGARLLDADGRANGMIMVSDKMEGDFTEEDEVLLRQVATTASLAIRLIEARDEAQQRAQEAIEAGAALREGAERLRLALEGGRMGRWEWDLQADSSFWDQRMYELLGLDASHPAESRLLLALVDSRDRNALQDALRRAAAGGGDFHTEFRLVRPHGETVWLTLCGKAIVDDSTRGARMFGVLYDITLRKQMEGQLRRLNDELEEEVQAQTEELRDTIDRLQGEAARRIDVEGKLRRHSQLLEGFFQHTITPLAFMDREFNFIRVNQAYAAADGKTPEDFAGKNHFALYPHAENRMIFERVVQTKQTYHAYAKPFTYPDSPRRGTSYWNWQLTPLFDERGEVQFLVLNLEDVTQRQQAFQELERRARVLQQLTLELSQAEDRERRRLAEILHDDLQQHLAAAKFHLGILNGRIKHDPSVRTMSGQLDQILTDAIEKSRSLSHELSPAVLHHSSLGETFEWLARHVQTKHGLTVHVDAEEQIHLKSEAMKTFLYKAAQEILFNIVKHARVREAWLRLKHMRGKLLLTIADRGQGFDPQTLEKTGGFGLLSIRERIELLGGRMKVRSVKGRGSVFVMAMPDGETIGRSATVLGPIASGSATSAIGVADVPGLPGPRLRIVLADDHKVMREGLAALLNEQTDMDVVGHAGNGREAVNLACDLRPDVVIMDVSMPLMGGEEASRQIKLHMPKTRIIALSMFEEVGVAETMRKAGAEKYLLKTAPFGELLTAIRGQALS